MVTLGEGVHGEQMEEEVTVKVINTSQTIECADNVKEEVCVHKVLNHPNMVRLFGHQKEGPMVYLFLEYCSGGQLFDPIKPDVGMAETHTENILLNDNDELTDFSLATMFCFKERERLLSRLCGTLPYVAPELLSQSEYRA
uniref:non-specific serine/threonine protein kinase n=1 Tax=Gouania willdenowi TaxID=441366 RepID=A0A8C5DI69_GOUWI